MNRDLAEAQRRVMAATLERVAHTLAEVQRSLETIQPAADHRAYASELDRQRMALCALARQLQHHGQADMMFGGLEPVIPNEPFRTWNDRGQR